MLTKISTPAAERQREPFLAEQLQAELCRRSGEAVLFDPRNQFDSTMSGDQVRTQFMDMVERSRRSCIGG
jgi:hypothetical protein